jgi:hypothetical protein
MATTTIRIPADLRDRLTELAASEGVTTSALLARLVREHEERLADAHDKQEFFEQLAEDFRRLRSDPEAWAEYQREIELWDSTLKDGLEYEPRWEDDEPEPLGA